MGGKVSSGVGAACATGAAMSALAHGLGSDRQLWAGAAAAATVLVIAAIAYSGPDPGNEEPPMHQHNLEYKAVCPEGHAMFGPDAAAGCARCQLDDQPIILETKEGGRAVAYPDPWEDANPWEERL